MLCRYKMFSTKIKKRQAQIIKLLNVSYILSYTLELQFVSSVRLLSYYIKRRLKLTSLSVSLTQFK